MVTTPNPTSLESETMMDPTINHGVNIPNNARWDPEAARLSAQSSFPDTQTAQYLRDPVTGMPYERELQAPDAARGYEIKPVSQTLSERVLQNGAYSDPTKYMAEARLEAVRVAKGLGIDLTSPEGAQWMMSTMESAKAAIPEFVRAPAGKGTFIETKNGMFDTVKGTFIQPPDQLMDFMGRPPQAPMLPASGVMQVNQGQQQSQSNDPSEALYQNALNILQAAAQDPTGKLTNDDRVKNAMKFVQDYKAEQRAQATEKRAQEKANKPPEKDLPQGLVERVSDARSALQMVEDLKPLLAKNVEIGGPVWGQISTRNPWDNDTQAFQADLDLTKQIIGKYLEGGVLRKEDESKYAKILPQATDTVKVRMDKADKLSNKLKDKFNFDLDTFKRSGYNMDNFQDLFQKKPEGEEKKKLTPEIARQYFAKAGKNKQKAMQLAQQDGYTE